MYNVCLVSFFWMLRKRHLLASSAQSFDLSQQLLRSDLQFFPWGVLMDMRWGKTIQFRERVVQLPLPLIPGSPLGPATAIQRALSFITTPPPPPLRNPRLSCGRTLFHSGTRFSPTCTLNFCGASMTSFKPSVCQPTILPVILFGGGGGGGWGGCLLCISCWVACQAH